MIDHLITISGSIALYFIEVMLMGERFESHFFLSPYLSSEVITEF